MDTDGDGQRRQRLQTIKCSHRINLYRHQFHGEAIATSNWRFGARLSTLIHILNTNNIYLKYPWATERLPITISIAHASLLSEVCAAEDTEGSTRLHAALLFFSSPRQAMRTYGSYDKWHASHDTKKKRRKKRLLQLRSVEKRNARTKSRCDFDIFYKLM